MPGYDEACVIFNRYIDNSLKAQKHWKRSAGTNPVKFNIKDSTNIKLVPLKTLLSHKKTKSKLTDYCIRHIFRGESGAIREFINTRKYLPPIPTHECDLCTQYIALLDREFNHSRKCLKVPIREKLDSRNIWRIQYLGKALLREYSESNNKIVAV